MNTLLFIGITLLIYIWYQVYRHIEKTNIEKLERKQKIDELLHELNKNFIPKFEAVFWWDYATYAQTKKLYEEYADRYKTWNQWEIIIDEEISKFFKDRNNYRIRYNKNYIQECKSSYKQMFVDLDESNHGLTDKQLDAVFCDEDAILVNAWAGSWKTKTLESKIAFLSHIKNIDIKDMLIITYSKKSQEDMFMRINSTIDKLWVESRGLKKNVVTFHAYGKSIIDKYNSQFTSDGAIWEWWNHKQVIDDIGQSKIIDEAMQKVRSDSIFSKLISDYLLFYTPIQVSVEQFDNLNDYYKHNKRNLRTLIKDNNKYNVSVKSYWEFLIANYCVSKWLNVQYEPSWHQYIDDTWYTKSYKPDFYLPDYKIYIEYFWVDKNNNTAPEINAKDYTTRMNKKILDHKNAWNILIDIRYADLQRWVEFFLKKLDDELTKYNVEYTTISIDELYAKHLQWWINWLTRTLQTFLSLYKESWKTIEDLSAKVDTFDLLNIIRNKLFIRIFEVFFNHYQSLLTDKNMMDFWDMIYLSIKLLDQWLVSKQFKYILVDEFQDISSARTQLILETMKCWKNTKVFCVGDDRQSIYQFAWSNANIFINFNKYFWYTEHITLDKTFRFNQWISKVSWAFVMENPSQSRKELQAINNEVEDKIWIIQKDEHRLLTFQALLDDMDKDMTQRLKLKSKIMYLSRYSLKKQTEKGDDSFITFIRNHFERSPLIKDNTILLTERDKNIEYDDTYTLLDAKNFKKYKWTYVEWKDNVIYFFTKSHMYEVHTMTIHKSKWLEWDYVIVDYVNEWWWLNFPSDIEDDPILQIITSESQELYKFAEERRLFYVGITRWKHKCYVLYNHKKESLFIKNIIDVDKKSDDKTIQIFKHKHQEDHSLLDYYNKPKCPKCNWMMMNWEDTNIWCVQRYCINYKHNCWYKEREINWRIVWSIECYGCGWYMTIKKNNKTNEFFRWCSNYPTCKCTENL